MYKVRVPLTHKYNPRLSWSCWTKHCYWKHLCAVLERCLPAAATTQPLKLPFGNTGQRTKKYQNFPDIEISKFLLSSEFFLKRLLQCQVNHTDLSLVESTWVSRGDSHEGWSISWRGPRGRVCWGLTTSFLLCLPELTISWTMQHLTQRVLSTATATTTA